MGQEGGLGLIVIELVAVACLPPSGRRPGRWGPKSCFHTSCKKLRTDSVGWVDGCGEGSSEGAEGGGGPGSDEPDCLYALAAIALLPPSRMRLSITRVLSPAVTGVDSEFKEGDPEPGD